MDRKRKPNMYSIYPRKFGYNMYVFREEPKDKYDMYSDAIDVDGLKLLPHHSEDGSHFSVVDPETGTEVCSSKSIGAASMEDHLAHVHEMISRMNMKKSEKPFLNYNKKKHSKSGGLNDSYREKYNRENGSHLKRPVTGKVKAGSKAANRRKSFCARMSGAKGATSKDGKLTPKGAALKRWKCSKSESLVKRCWEGYKPAPGKAPYSKGSCVKKGEKLEHYSPQSNLSSIDPAKQGSGVDARARRDTWHPHSFYYRAGSAPESMIRDVANSKYSIEIPDEAKLYDLSTDVDGHYKDSPNMEETHEKLKANGYHGFYASQHSRPEMRNVVALYHSQPVNNEEKIGR